MGPALFITGTDTGVGKTIVAGGIATGAQMAAAFCLGAEAVQIGTRFICTKECEGHDNFKKAILAAGETSTTVTLRNLAPVRNLKNGLTDQIHKMETSGEPMQKILEFIGFGRAEKASIEGDVQWGTVQAGQVAGMIEEIPTVKDLIDAIMEEASTVLRTTTF